MEPRGEQSVTTRFFALMVSTAKRVTKFVLSLVPTCTAARWVIVWLQETLRIPITITPIPTATMSPRLGATSVLMGKCAKTLAQPTVPTTIARLTAIAWQLLSRFKVATTIQLPPTIERTFAKTVGMAPTAPQLVLRIAPCLFARRRATAWRGPRSTLPREASTRVTQMTMTEPCTARMVGMVRRARTNVLRAAHRRTAVIMDTALPAPSERTTVTTMLRTPMIGRLGARTGCGALTAPPRALQTARKLGVQIRVTAWPVQQKLRSAITTPQARTIAPTTARTAIMALTALSHAPRIVRTLGAAVVVIAWPSLTVFPWETEAVSTMTLIKPFGASLGFKEMTAPRRVALGPTAPLLVAPSSSVVMIPTQRTLRQPAWRRRRPLPRAPPQ
jgi:hypothetical protein